MPGKPDESLAVLIGDARVGTLAETPDGLVAFQYDSGWLRSGYSINPYSLPLSDELFVPKQSGCSGLCASTLSHETTMTMRTISRGFAIRGNGCCRQRTTLRTARASIGAI